MDIKSKTIQTQDLAVEVKTACIVVFRSLRDAGRLPEVHYQVTLDPALVSPSGQYIRLGMNKGDEINGWQPVKEIVVVEKLGEWIEDTPPNLQLGTAALSFDFERVLDDGLLEPAIGATAH